MDTNVILQIVIALVALFWLFSTACSYVVEGINSIITNLRAEALERFICEMIVGEDNAQDAYQRLPGKLSKSPIADPLGILSHGLITSLRKPKSGSTGDGTAPTYIPAQIFSKVLLDRLSTLALTMAFDVKAVEAVIAVLTRQDVQTPVEARKQWGNVAERLLKLDPAGNGTFAFGHAVLEGPSDETIDQGIARLTILLNCCLVATKDSGDAGTRAAGAQMSSLMASAIAALQGFKGAPKKRLWPRILDVLFGRVDNGAKAVPKISGDFAIAKVIKPGAMWMLVARGMTPPLANDQAILDLLASVIERAPIPTSLRESLRPIFANSNFDLAMLRTGIESWYDDVMQRASGWFKRNTTWKLFAVGLTATIALNVNPLLIVGDLSRDPQLRAAGVDFAQSAAAEGSPIVGQQIVFAKAADRLEWEPRLDRVKTSSSAAPQSTAASAATVSVSAEARELRRRTLMGLAVEIEPLLVRSGPFVGLLPWATSPFEGDDAYTERADILYGICGAHLQDNSRTPRERVVGSTNVDKKWVMDHWKDETTCKELRQQFGDSAKTRMDDRRVFWGSQLVVWDQDLGRDLWEALVAVQEDASAKASADSARRVNVALPALRASLRHAIDVSGKIKKYADNFLDRIPSLGWDSHASPQCEGRVFAQWSCANSPGSHLLSILVYVFGWMISALMVSFGAPFWFDLMSKLVNRRVTGPRPTNTDT